MRRRSASCCLPLLVACALVAALSAGCRTDDSATSNPSSSSSSSAGAHSERRACVVGADGAIFLTTDGEHWQQRPSGTRATLLDVDFADSQNGWAVGFDGTILRTADGGLTWTAQTSGLEGSERSLLAVACLSPSTAWVVGHGVALLTTDGGAHWLQSRSVVGAGPTPAGSHDVDFAGARRGWAAHGLEILATSDGGMHWTTRHKETPTGDATLFNLVASGGGDHVWAAGMVGPAGGEAGVVLGSRDGGRTWRRVLETVTPVGDLWSSHAGRVWALCGDALYRSLDGGAHWRRVRHAGGSALAFADARHGWRACERPGKCIILGTDDGGLTWRTQAEIDEDVMLYVGGITAY